MGRDRRVSGSSGDTPVPPHCPLCHPTLRVTLAHVGNPVPSEERPSPGTAPHAVPGDRAEGLRCPRTGTSKATAGRSPERLLTFLTPRVLQGPWPCPGACGLPNHLQWGAGRPCGSRKHRCSCDRAGQGQGGSGHRSRLVGSSGRAARGAPAALLSPPPRCRAVPTDSRGLRGGALRSWPGTGPPRSGAPVCVPFFRLFLAESRWTRRSSCQVRPTSVYGATRLRCVPGRPLSPLVATVVCVCV